MRSLVLSCCFLILLNACSSPTPDAEPTAKTSADPAATATPAPATAQTPAEAPEEIVRQFFEAGNAVDEEAMLALMTAKAREAMSGEDSEMTGQTFESYEIDEATITGDTADVPVDVVEAGTPQKLTMKLRNEENAWRIYGVAIELGDAMAMTINFEEFADMFEDMANQMGEALASGMEQAFGGLSGEDLEARKAAFDALTAVDQSAYEAMWTNSTDYQGKTASEAIHALAEGVGLSVHAGDHAAALESNVAIDVTGLSNIEAIERISHAAGLYPVFPTPEEDWGMLGDVAEAMAEGLAGAVEGALPEGAAEADAEQPAGEPALNALTFEAGKRTYPVQFAGPFVFAVEDVTTNPPNPTGSLTFSISAYGLSPAILSVLASDFGSTEIQEVTGPDGASLTRGYTTYIGGGAVAGGIYAATSNVSLYNMLRAVDTIASISGVQRMTLPSIVQEFTLENVAEGQTQTVGDFQVAVESAEGSSTNLRITGPEDRIERVKAVYWAIDAEGNGVDVAMENTDSWEPGVATSSIQTFEPHTTLRVKLVEMSEPLDYTFDLTNVPVQGYEEMPEQIEELTFEGSESPITAEFVKFLDEEESFRSVAVAVTNHSNKNAESVSTTFVYLDADGNVLDDWPNTLTGEFGPDGLEPIAAGSTTEQEATAFGAPEGTEGIRIEVDNVEFADGTSWRADDV